MAPSKQLRCQVTELSVGLCTWTVLSPLYRSASNSIDSAQPLWFDVLDCCIAIDNLKSNLSIQTDFKLPPDVVWIRFKKIKNCISVFFCYPKCSKIIMCGDHLGRKTMLTIEYKGMDTVSKQWDKPVSIPTIFHWCSFKLAERESGS